MSKTSTHTTTGSEIDKAITDGHAFDLNATKILTAHYDLVADQLAAHLSTGATLTVPRSAISFLSMLTPEEIGKAEVEAPGYGIWFVRPDIGIRLSTLIEIAIGSHARDIAARTLGASKSPAKTLAARKNGAKGGRPRKDRL